MNPPFEAPAAEAIPLAEFRKQVLELYQPPLRAPATLKKMRQTLDIAIGLCEGGSTADLTVGLVARFIEARKDHQCTNTTISMLSSLRAACNVAVAMGWLRISPFAIRKSWLRRSAPKGKQHHSREEIARVLALMGQDVTRKTGWAQWRARRLQALAATVAYTGLRKMEAISLLHEDIDMSGGLILIVSRDKNRLKTERSAQPVPIPQGLALILNNWLPYAQCEWVFPNVYQTGPWIGGSPGYKPLDRLKRLGKRAGVEGFTFLSLRHSWATHAEWWGLSPAMIQRVLRHSSGQTQWHYRHADHDNMRDAVDGIDFADPTAEGPTP